jgi:hypothetical protein
VKVGRSSRREARSLGAGFELGSCQSLFPPPRLGPEGACPGSAAVSMRVVAPATRHAEFRSFQVTAVVRLQHLLHLAANVRPNVNAPPFQRATKRLRHGSAQQSVHVQFGNAARQSLCRKRPDDHFPAVRGSATPAAHHEQSRCRVKHRRHMFLPDRDGDSHARTRASNVPAGYACITLLRFCFSPLRLRQETLQNTWRNAIKLSRPSGEMPATVSHREGGSTSWQNATAGDHERGEMQRFRLG